MPDGWAPNKFHRLLPDEPAAEDLSSKREGRLCYMYVEDFMGGVARFSK